MNIEYLIGFSMNTKYFYYVNVMHYYLGTYSNKTMNNNWFGCIVNQAIRYLL